MKIYAGIATLTFAREPSAKAKKYKNDVTDTPGIAHPTLRVRGVRVSAVLIAACEMAVNIRSTTKLLNFKTFMAVGKEVN